YGYGPVTPGELVALFGTGLGPAALQTAEVRDNRFPTSIANTRVLFDEIAAPLVYTSIRQIAAIVPFGISGTAATKVLVETGSGRSNPVMMTVSGSAPALFTADASGKGAGAILNQNQSVNSASNPENRGSVIVLYGTGAGPMSPMPVDGALIVDANTRIVAPVSVTIGGQAAEV